MSEMREQPYGLVVGAVLAQLRERHQIRQADMAERLGVAQSSMSRIESGQAIPDAVMLRRAAATFRLPHGRLMDLADEAMSRTQQAARHLLKIPAKSWWPATEARLDGQGIRALVTLAVSAVLTEDRHGSACV